MNWKKDVINKAEKLKKARDYPFPERVDVESILEQFVADGLAKYDKYDKEKIPFIYYKIHTIRLLKKELDRLGE